MVELTDFIEGMRTSVIPNESAESLIVFQSLSRMLSNPQQTESTALDSQLPWQKYLAQSIRDLKCSVRDLCHEFGSNFKCDPEGHLNIIILNRMGPFAHLNLAMIPKTVVKLTLSKCGLTSVSAWSDLKGKSLESLRIYEPLVLKLNLDGLRGTLNELPLEHLFVGRCQVSEYFGLQTYSPSDPALPEIKKWMRASTLVNLTIESRDSRNKMQRRRRISSQREGTWQIVID